MDIYTETWMLWEYCSMPWFDIQSKDTLYMTEASYELTQC